MKEFLCSLKIIDNLTEVKMIRSQEMYDELYLYNNEF